MSTYRDDIVALDKRYLWHPYTSMDDYVARVRPLVIERAEGARLLDADGRVFLDGNSSWWVAGLGHRHPRLVAALVEQAGRLCHTSLAGVTHAPAALLARDLVAVAPSGLTRVFFSDDGSTAVEVAAKLAVQFFAQHPDVKKRGKKRLAALEGAFHGDTIGCASLGGVDVFRHAFGSLMFDVVRVPSSSGTTYPGADFEAAFATLEAAITGAADELAAVIVEPVVQGAAGMRFYPPAYLTRLRRICSDHDVLLIADEVFTGYGRTGPMWACDHAGIAPDLLCVAKSFSGGMLPMAATLATDRLYDGFLGGVDRAFLHGHSFTGNPLGAAVAREVLAVYRDEAVLEKAAVNARRLDALRAEVAARIGADRCRQLGMIAAFDLGGSGYRGGIGWRVYDEALARGAYVRPLGDTVYLCPPLNITDEDLSRLCAITAESIAAVL